MDIKEKINKLTEVEAKAALYWAIQRVAVYGSCFVCDRGEKCKKDDGVDCDIEFLRQSLKEARE